MQVIIKCNLFLSNLCLEDLKFVVKCTFNHIQKFSYLLNLITFREAQRANSQVDYKAKISYICWKQL